MSYAIHALQELPLEPKTRCVSFFFYGRGPPLERTVLGFYREVLRQFARKDMALLEILTKRYKKRCEELGPIDEKWSWKEIELERILFKYVKDIPMPRQLWIFTDTLDEAGDEAARILAGKLNDLVGVASKRIEICFSCRHYPILRKHTLRKHTTLKLCVEDGNEADMVAFTKKKIETYQHRLSNVQVDGLVGYLRDRGQGIFLWVDLIIKTIGEQMANSLPFILGLVKTLPTGLEGVY